MEKIIFFLFLLQTILYSEEKLIIISPHWEGVKIEIEIAFKNWYFKNYGKAIKLEWIDQGGTSDDLKFVESLFKKNPNGIGIDVFFGGGIEPYLRLKEKNILYKYKVDEKILKKIPEKCLGIPNYDKDFYWYGIVLSGFGILYNKKVCDYLNLPFPKTWEDLGKDIYFSWIGAADPRHSGSMHMMYEIILQAYGWKKGWQTIFFIAGNTKSFSSSASQVAKDTSIGEVCVSLCIDSYALSQIEINGEENMEFILPKNLTIINPDAIGILKGAPNLFNATTFINFLLSYESQVLWMLKKGEENGPKEFSLNRLSILPDIYKNERIFLKNINPYLYKHSIPYNMKLASERWALINDIIGWCIIEPHRELQKAWEYILKNKKSELKEKFAQLPFDENSQNILLKSWNNPIFRNQQINKWFDFSRNKFKKIYLNEN